MATGEGKTLSGALAAAGYVRRGHRVQVMSVNDYLARRDAEWMGPVYELLGVSVGWVTQASTPERAAAGLRRGRVLRVSQRDRLRRAPRPAGHPRGRPGHRGAGRDPHRRGRLGAGGRGAGAPGAGRLGRGRRFRAGDGRDRRAPAAPAALRSGRRAPQRVPHRRGRPDRRAGPGRDQPLRRAEPGRPHPAQRRAARPGPAPAGRGLHRPGRPDPPDQCLARPGGPAAALAGRPARGGRGQGGTAGQRERPDPGQHHGPGPGPALPGGLRDDRYRGGGGRAAA